MKKNFKIPFILRNGVILQRDKCVSIWGSYLANKRITIFLNKEKYTTISNNFGYFKVQLSQHKAGGPYRLVFKADNEQLEVNDILFGDVWVLAGQSNMQLWMDRLKSRYPNEIERADNSQIRFFNVPQKFNFKKPLDDLQSGNWEYAVGDALKGLSGIGYFFAKEYYARHQVPIGLISTAIGGTHIESWMSRNVLNKLGFLPENFTRLTDDDYINMVQKNDADYEKWYQAELIKRDYGLKNAWDGVVNDSNWEEADLRHPFNLKYCTPGVIWLRKKIKIPSNLVGLNGRLEFGTFTDADEIYVNGRKVGSTGYKYPPRNYEIGRLSNELQLVIRLIISSKFGGPTISKHHLIVTSKGNVNVDFLGNWKIKRGCTMPVKHEPTFFQYEPTGLFNGMIYPLRRIQVAGIIWYQGESDTGKPYSYSKLFINLIQEWRKLFCDEELPFLFCQLPNCGIEPQHDWSQLRDEQRKSLVLRKTAMIVTLGLGEDDDLHPLNKSPIGNSLCKSIDKLSKFPNGYSNGPLPLYARQIENRIWVKFMTFEEGLKVNAGGYFDLIDNGTKRVLADYNVDGNFLMINLADDFILTRNAVLRYGWTNTPKSFIFNRKNNPASSFELKIHVLSINSKS